MDAVSPILQVSWIAVVAGKHLHLAQSLEGQRRSLFHLFSGRSGCDPGVPYIASLRRRLSWNIGLLYCIVGEEKKMFCLHNCNTFILQQGWIHFAFNQFGKWILCKIQTLEKIKVQLTWSWVCGWLMTCKCYLPLDLEVWLTQIPHCSHLLLSRGAFADLHETWDSHCRHAWNIGRLEHAALKSNTLFHHLSTRGAKAAANNDDMREDDSEKIMWFLCYTRQQRDFESACQLLSHLAVPWGRGVEARQENKSFGFGDIQGQHSQKSKLSKRPDSLILCLRVSKQRSVQRA